MLLQPLNLRTRERERRRRDNRSLTRDFKVQSCGIRGGQGRNGEPFDEAGVYHLIEMFSIGVIAIQDQRQRAFIDPFSVTGERLENLATERVAI